jgi:uncharacterized protein (DUF2344 family)
MQENNQLTNQAPNDNSSSKNQTETTIINLGNRLTDVSSRLKILEERYNTLRKTIQLTEKNSIDNEKKNFSEFQIISENVLIIKKTLQEFSEKITILESEINTFVSLHDFKVVERYLGFWQPMDFVTRDEVNAFLRKKFKELQEEKNNINNIQNSNDASKNTHIIN